MAKFKPGDVCYYLGSKSYVEKVIKGAVKINLMNITWFIPSQKITPKQTELKFNNEK